MSESSRKGLGLPGMLQPQRAYLPRIVARFKRKLAVHVQAIIIQSFGGLQIRVRTTCFLRNVKYWRRYALISDCMHVKRPNVRTEL